MSDSDNTKSLAWPHGLGVTKLAFSPDALFLYTSGAEGYIRVVDADLTHQEPFEIALVEYHAEAITALTTSKDLLCSTSEEGVVVLHRATKDGKGGMELEGIVTRCNLPVRDAKFSPRGDKVAVASDELIVKVVSTRDHSDIVLLTGHKKSVRSVSWSPDGNLLTTADSEGTIKFWDMSRAGEQSCIETMEGVMKALDPESEYASEVLWHPSGKYFVCVTKSDEIGIFSATNYTKTGTFSTTENGGNHTQISALAFSSNGHYLASAGKDGNIIVWSTATRTEIHRTKHGHDHLVTALAFHPGKKANHLAWVDYGGRLVQWNDVVPGGESSGLKLPGGPPDGVAGEEDDFEKELEGDETWMDDWVEGGDEGLNDTLKMGIMQGAQPSRDGVREKVRERERSVGRERRREETVEEEDEEEDVMGEGYGYRREKSRELERERRSDWKGSSFDAGSYLAASKGQEVFQPGATPFKEKARYMAFNMLGLIKVVEREEHNLVTVEFHDHGAQLGFTFEDSLKFDLGALGELGCVFSCKSSGSEKDVTAYSPSMIYYRPYESWTNAENWRYSLPPSESVVALATGGIAEAPQQGWDDEVSITGTGTVMAATDRGYIRFFTGSGLQKYVWNLGEEVIALAAGKDMGLIVYRAQGVVDKKQGLEYLLVDTDSFEVVQQGKVPLRKNALLKWVGFTDDHIPAMYDSDGLLSILDRCRRPRQARWVPALDMSRLARAEGKQESYWPIGVTQQHVHAIILKGLEKYPHFPTPLFQEMDLQFPLLRLDVPQGLLEEQYLRETLFVSHKRDGAAPDDYVLKTELAREELETDKHLLKVIQTSCKAEKLQAALDATLMLTQPASIDAALKIAAFFRLPSLEERIEKVKEAKTGIRSAEEENKRKAKWSHLVDDRTIVAPPSSSRGATARSTGMFSTAPTRGPASTAPRSSYQPSVAAKSQKMEHLDSGFGGSDDAGQDESMDGEAAVEETGEEDLYDPAPYSEDEPVEEQEVEQFVEEPEEIEAPAAQAPKKALNPFAKRAAAKVEAPPSSSNPFAAKKGSKATDIKRTDSFFGRVEDKSSSKGKGGKKTANAASTSAAPKPKGMQTTLFGLPPVDPSTIEKKGKNKKRKSMADIEEEDSAPAPKAKARDIGSFLKKASSTVEEEEEMEMEETQVVSQKSAAESSPAPDEEEDEEAPAPSAMDFTQMEATQIEDVASVSAGDGISKLAQFRATTMA